ncbi:MAG: hypothetical protein GY917_16160, partial [Planctomycetaceae bacterium]|nr:hypothetical protein [Planctomycetaceae bacterium]
KTFDGDQFAAAIQQAINASPLGVTVGVSGNRMNFLGAESGKFQSLDDVTGTGVFSVNSSASGSIRGGYTGIDLLVSDTADEVSAKMVAAMGTRIPGADAEQISQGRAVQVGMNWEFVSTDERNDPVLDNPSTLYVGGSGPGGFVTGLSYVDGEVFAVSDKGGLYKVKDYRQDSTLNNYGTAYLEYLPESAVALLGKDLQGLVAGPTRTELARQPIESISIDTPMVVTAVRHGLQDGATITIKDNDICVDDADSDGDDRFDDHVEKHYEVRNATPDTFELYDFQGEPAAPPESLATTGWGGHIYDYGVTVGPHHTTL